MRQLFTSRMSPAQISAWLFGGLIRNGEGRETTAREDHASNITLHTAGFRLQLLLHLVNQRPICMTIDGCVGIFSGAKGEHFFFAFIDQGRASGGVLAAFVLSRNLGRKVFRNWSGDHLRIELRTGPIRCSSLRADP